MYHFRGKRIRYFNLDQIFGLSKRIAAELFVIGITSLKSPGKVVSTPMCNSTIQMDRVLALQTLIINGTARPRPQHITQYGYNFATSADPISRFSVVIISIYVLTMYVEIDMYLFRSRDLVYNNARVCNSENQNDAVILHL